MANLMGPSSMSEILPSGDDIEALLLKLVDSLNALADTKAPRLFVSDNELIRRLGVPEKIARQTLQSLDDDPQSGFPQKQKAWGGRRYWPAVRRYLDRTNGLSAERPPLVNRQ